MTRRDWTDLALAVAFAVLVALAVYVSVVRAAETRPDTQTVHASGCHTKACWRRVHEARRRRWCERHTDCLWRSRLAHEPAGEQAWAQRTFGCETGYTYNPAVHDRRGRFHGGMQFALGTWSNAQRYVPSSWRFYGDPHTRPMPQQKVVAIRLKRHEGRGHWPVCG